MNARPPCSSACRNALAENTPLRKVEVSAEESKILASFGLLTRKPVLIVFNMGESQSAPVWEFETPSVALQGKLEMEIAQLSPRMPRSSCRSTASRSSA